MIRKSMPSGLTRWVETGFPSRQTRNAFARRSCSNKELEHDVGSTSSHHALGPATQSCRMARLRLNEKRPLVTTFAHQNLSSSANHPNSSPARPAEPSITCRWRNNHTSELVFL